MRARALAFAALLAACAPSQPAVDAGALDAASDAAPSDASAPDAPDAMEASAPARGVGVQTRPWVDTSRPTAAHGDAGSSPQRNLPTEVWYPTVAGTAGLPETRDAPVDPAGAPYPLVLFVHGSSSARTQSAFLTRALAAAGYVVAAADHPLTAVLTPGGPTDLHVDDEVGDLAFLAAQLERAASDTADSLRGAVDARRFVVLAHSTGGAVALLAHFGGALRPRGHAGTAVLSPRSCYFGQDFFRGSVAPLFIVSATRDPFVPPPLNGDRVYALATMEARTLLTLPGATHLGFTDVNIPDDSLNPSPTSAGDALSTALRPWGDSAGCTPAPPPSTDALMPFATQHRFTVQWVRAFVDATLRGQRAEWDALRASPDPAVRVQSGP